MRKLDLERIKIPGTNEELVVSMFADDTLVYMNKKDSLKKLNRVIELFCKASTAKFNLEKTEYLPIGREEYGKKVTRTRKFGKNKIDDGLNIIKEGEAM